jgi:ankyrin repeat protein
MTDVAAKLIPNLGVYRKQAKQLKRAFSDGEQAAVSRVRTVLADRGASTKQELTLGDAQFVIASELGFSSWRKFKERILELEAAPPPDPLTSLLDAVKASDVDRVAELLRDDSALANSQSASGESPLIEACDRGDANMVEALLAAGADPRGENQHATPLLAATHAGPHKSGPAHDVIALLLAHGAPDDVFLQAALGNVDELEAHLVGVDDVDERGPLDCTALYLATWNGHVGTAKLLLDRGANPSLTGRGGQTPLACAMEHSWSPQHREVARALVEGGADCSLFEACRIAHLPTVERLLRDSDINTTNDLGYRPLDIAVFEGNIDLAQMLIDRGARDPEGRAAALLRAKVTRDVNLGPQLFQRVNLSQTVFHDSNLGGSTFSDVNLFGARFDNVNLGEVHIQDAHIAGLTIWGVDIMPLVLAAMAAKNQKD